MLSKRMMTTGDSLPVTHINPFHMISANVTIMPENRQNYNFSSSNRIGWVRLACVWSSDWRRLAGADQRWLLARADRRARERGEGETLETKIETKREREV